LNQTFPRYTTASGALGSARGGNTALQRVQLENNGGSKTSQGLSPSNTRKGVATSNSRSYMSHHNNVARIEHSSLTGGAVRSNTLETRAKLPMTPKYGDPMTQINELNETGNNQANQSLGVIKHRDESNSSSAYPMNA
jgi:hypothetical protein